MPARTCCLPRLARCTGLETDLLAPFPPPGRTPQASLEAELLEASSRCCRLQAQADDACHQRDRLQAALAGSEEALRDAEEERVALAEAQARLHGKAREAAELQEEAARWVAP